MKSIIALPCLYIFIRAKYEDEGQNKSLDRNCSRSKKTDDCQRRKKADAHKEKRRLALIALESACGISGNKKSDEQRRYEHQPRADDNPDVIHIELI